MELADVTDSKSVGSDTVWVRVPPPAPEIDKLRVRLVDFTFSLLTLHFSVKVSASQMVFLIAFICVTVFCYQNACILGVYDIVPYSDGNIVNFTGLHFNGNSFFPDKKCCFAFEKHKYLAFRLSVI